MKTKLELVALAHKAQDYKADNVERSAGERWVTMSNALTRAGHGLTLAEKRIVASAVSKLDSYNASASRGDVPRTKITADEYAQTFDVDMNTAYDQLQEAAKMLYSRSITFYEPAYRRNGKPLPPTKVQMRWVGSVKYQKGEGWVELAWWPDLMRHLLNLRQQFTTYQLQQASALRSTYSWKLLELLMRFESTGWAEYTIEDFGQIKRRIIDQAVKELTEKDGWIIELEQIKAGRKVKAIRFKFMRNPQKTLEI